MLKVGLEGGNPGQEDRMKTIWKFPLDVADEQRVEMPLDAKILHVGLQGESVFMWAEVGPERRKVERTVRIYGTGYPMPEHPGRHIGSFMLRGGTLVFHAYDPIA